MAIFAADEGDVAGALSMLKESLRISRDFGDRGGMADAPGHFAAVLGTSGRAEEAARLLSSVQVLQQEFGSTGAWPAKENEEALGRIRAQLEEAAFAEAWAQGRASTLDGSEAEPGGRALPRRRLEAHRRQGRDLRVQRRVGAGREPRGRNPGQRIWLDLGFRRSRVCHRLP